MTTFAYSSGTPANLVGGHSASMSDISGPFADIVTFVNGNIDATNLATNAVGTSELQALSVTGAKIAADTVDAGQLATAAKPVTLLAPYRVIAEATSTYFGGATSGTYDVCPGQNIVKTAVETFAPKSMIPIVPTDYAVSGRTAMLRVFGFGLPNATVPGVTFTFGLYAIAGFAGGNSAQSITIGTLVTGSATSAMSLAGGLGSALSSDFALPASGVYTLGVVLSGTVAAASFGTVGARLEIHHV